MPFVVAPVLPFPNILWWSFAKASPELLLDEKEHFEKMSFRNRYLLAGPDGVVTMSIPLSQGRQQRKAMDEVLIDNKTKWQTQHWRTLVSLYNRSPYFEFFAPELEILFTKPFEQLTHFSKESILICGKLAGIKNQFLAAENYQANYPEAIADIRKQFRSNEYAAQAEIFPGYTQTFEDRTGFFPNLSLLDLLFAEGKRAPEFIPKPF